METPPQTGLKRHQRLVNLAGAFRVKSGFEEVVEGRPVLLIDDILTTGSTSGECARTLLEAGSGPIRLGVLGAGIVGPEEA